MKLKLVYTGQLGMAAGISEEEVEVSPGTTVAEVLEEAGARLPAGFRKFVFGQDGAVEMTLLLALDGEQLNDPSTRIGEGAMELMLLPPIAGG